MDHLDLVAIFFLVKTLLKLTQILQSSLVFFERHKNECIIVIDISWVLFFDDVSVFTDCVLVEVWIDRSREKVDQIKLQIFFLELSWVLNQIEHNFCWGGQIILLEIRLSQENLVFSLVLLLRYCLQIRYGLLILPNKIQVVNVEGLEWIFGRRVLEKNLQVIKNVDLKRADDQTLLIFLITWELLQQYFWVFVYFVVIVLLYRLL